MDASAEVADSFIMIRGSKEKINMSEKDNKCRGSKYWMQKIANEPNIMGAVKDTLGCGSLNWISPLKDSYKEYQLNSEAIKKMIPELKDVKFSNIWPTKGPVWDGIAFSQEQHTLYLFEAKSYPGEMSSGGTDSAEGSKNRERIRKSLMITYNDLFTDEKNRCNEIMWKDKYKKIWEGKYYQLGNRLAFMHFMNNRKEDILCPNTINVKLVLINILKDDTHTGKDKESRRILLTEWEKHYRKTLWEMKYGELDKDRCIEDLEVVRIPTNVEIVYYDHEKNSFIKSKLPK